MARKAASILQALGRLGLAPDEMTAAATQAEMLARRQVEPGAALDEAVLMAMADVTPLDAARAAADWDRWARSSDFVDLVGVLNAEAEIQV